MFSIKVNVCYSTVTTQSLFHPYPHNTRYIHYLTSTLMDSSKEGIGFRSFMKHTAVTQVFWILTVLILLSKILREESKHFTLGLLRQGA